VSHTFYLTTAIDYVNNRPHLGTAYEKICADIIVRYQRFKGSRVRFLMGNDEHSLNVVRRARELGMEPLDYCDRMESEFRSVWRALDISYDDFIRTTEARHRRSVAKLIERIRAAGDIFEGVYEGWYCVSCEAFKQEKDLVDGDCPIHQRKADWIREKNHFFRLSRYQRPLLDHFERHPGFLEPEVRRNEMLRVLEGGLEDISISRAGQSWGIPLPFDPSSVVYVWFDALINYISAVGYANDEAAFAQWWPAAVHIVGKDITRFHALVWPGMLLSAGLELPRKVFGHGWVNLRGEKMSKSLGTIVDPVEAAEKLGADPLRLFLVREITFGGDGDFSSERLEERYNADLANNFGNLVSRVTAMAARYRSGALLKRSSSGRLPQVAEASIGRYRQAMDRFALQDGASAAFDLIDATNTYIAETEPWAMARDPAQADRLSRVLYDLAEAVRIAAILLLPAMPQACMEILRRVGAEKPLAEHRLEDSVWGAAGDRMTVTGDPLWPRLG
jgi:methionyl-tRNA synthetase